MHSSGRDQPGCRARAGAARASVPKDRCVMAMSSTRMLNSLARAVRLSRTCARGEALGHLLRSERTQHSLAACALRTTMHCHECLIKGAVVA